MKYDLERLGPFGFQDLCAALALKVFGAHVRPMGRGRDGGRDMLTTDSVRWSADMVWTGTTVFQVKHKERLTSPQTDAAVLWREIREELDSWASPDSGRGDVPHQLVFVSNVPLVPAGWRRVRHPHHEHHNWLAALGMTPPKSTSTGLTGRQPGRNAKRAGTAWSHCVRGASWTEIT